MSHFATSKTSISSPPSSSSPSTSPAPADLRFTRRQLCHLQLLCELRIGFLSQEFLGMSVMWLNCPKVCRLPCGAACLHHLADLRSDRMLSPHSIRPHEAIVCRVILWEPVEIVGYSLIFALFTYQDFTHVQSCGNSVSYQHAPCWFHHSPLLCGETPVTLDPSESLQFSAVGLNFSGELRSVWRPVSLPFSAQLRSG